MNEELAVREPENLTAKDVRAQVNLVQEVMQAVMKKGSHYGTIPGCGEKPTLLKPGAEKLASTFRLAINPEIEDKSTNDVARYRIRAMITHQITGAFLGAGVGECSSTEEKYNWRNAVCEEEYNETPEDKRRIKYKKYNNQVSKVKQVRTNPADIANTVLKMAKKRALVDGILTVTGASDIFTQDIEDMPEELLDKKESKPKPVQQESHSENLDQPPLDNEELDQRDVEEANKVVGPACGICGKLAHLIPAGTSKTSGKSYGAFYVCPAKCVVPETGKKWSKSESDWLKG